MGYSVFKFGALYLGNKIQPVPQKLIMGANAPLYDGNAISIKPEVQDETIVWIKPNSSNLLIADRPLLFNVSQEELKKNGFIKGQQILIDGQYFKCRLLQVGERNGAPNEWDKALDETGENDTLWHWGKAYFWGADRVAEDITSGTIRGWVSARTWNDFFSERRHRNIGFRPALEPLGSVVDIPNYRLDGADFRLSSLPGSNGFYPILQPTQENIFKGIPDGNSVKMYTFMKNGRPVRINKRISDPASLVLTDQYFGDEYLVPWTISNGIAVASRSLFSNSKG